MFSEFTIMVRFSGSCESSLLESEEDIKSLWGLEFISTKQLSKMISSSKYFPQNFCI
uniref:GM07077p n=1 Tax=Drosophila melanogaster TaxID=7227 RepID=Q95S70_DROME|nr:GM07077p [Drosophila melanogaster]